MSQAYPTPCIGIDIGGTFTDFVVYRPQNGTIETFKLLSTPGNPAEAVLEGLRRIPEAAQATITHGSTVATNALLERKGARTALVTTQGFRDVLQIGRQNRPSLYDWNADPPPPLIPAEWRFEVNERVDHNGQVLQALDLAQLPSLAAALQSAQISSVAVCLLFSFLRPEHELAITQVLRAAGFAVSPSCEVLPEYREYERTSTTAVNAYVSPVLDRYLRFLEGALPQANLRIMQSNGGMISLAEAGRNGVRCILSGPAGGVVGSQHIARLVTPSGQPLRMLTFDMGGTSTDVSLIAGEPRLTTESVVGGCPISIPMLDIHTIGAGGGSIATVDAGGALRVGPQSAGADPGPACYGRGDLPTVTDANLVLGRLAAEYFLDGQMRLDVERAQSALGSLAKQMAMSLTQAALGVIEVVNAHMERALRVISVERGHDPRECTLFSFGGAGGLHAADLARRLGIPTVLISPLASTLSAFGMLAAHVAKDYTQTVMLPGDTRRAAIAERLRPLAERGLAEIQAEGFGKEQTLIERLLDLRYQGQSYELTVPFSATVIEDFHAAHQQMYGYQRPADPVEIVNLRVRAFGMISPPELKRLPLGSTDPSGAIIEKRSVLFASGTQTIPFYRGTSLQPGNRIPGPGIILYPDTTILLGHPDTAEVDGYQNLLIKIHP